MLVKCPNCCREYELNVGKSVVEFVFKCPNCMAELVVTDEKKIILSSQASKSQPSFNTLQISSTNLKKSSGCFSKFFLSLIFIFVILVLTCPDSRAHKDKIQSVTTAAINHEIRAHGEDNEFAAIIGSLFSNKIAEFAITDKIVVENYLFFSTGYYYADGERKMVYLGFLNHIFTLSEEQIIMYMKKLA